MREHNVEDDLVASVVGVLEVVGLHHILGRPLRRPLLAARMMHHEQRREESQQAHVRGLGLMCSRKKGQGIRCNT